MKKNVFDSYISFEEEALLNVIQMQASVYRIETTSRVLSSSDQQPFSYFNAIQGYFAISAFRYFGI